MYTSSCVREEARAEPPTMLLRLLHLVQRWRQPRHECGVHSVAGPRDGVAWQRLAAFLLRQRERHTRNRPIGHAACVEYQQRARSRAPVVADRQQIAIILRGAAGPWREADLTAVLEGARQPNLRLRGILRVCLEHARNRRDALCVRPRSRVHETVPPPAHRRCDRRIFQVASGEGTAGIRATFQIECVPHEVGAWRVPFEVDVFEKVTVRIAFVSPLRALERRVVPDPPVDLRSGDGVKDQRVALLPRIRMMEREERVQLDRYWLQPRALVARVQVHGRRLALIEANHAAERPFARHKLQRHLQSARRPAHRPPSRRRRHEHEVVLCH
mmetsp:Transcript_35272/g.89529  ORF Transcript_35272/g.89529 Transcript_35272/m.89529 type:complete len:329 (+) Transcript_35272:182-1168(+)